MSIVLSVSIVAYRPDAGLLKQTLTNLCAAGEKLLFAIPSGSPIKLYLVDNGGLREMSAVLESLRARGIQWEVVSGHGNIGYGRGHNLAIQRTASRYHLILNPDIDLDEDALVRAFAFLEAHGEAGLLTPWICDDRGRQQYLCRRYPALMDLFVRGFLPAAWRVRFDARLARYEMRDLIGGSEVVWDPPIVSGCFMLFRTEVLKELGGFDPRYFLYFEDYDLSLRTHAVARVAYVPSVRVVHHGGGASRKGFAHVRMFAASAFRFYNRFGWRWW